MPLDSTQSRADDLAPYFQEASERFGVDPDWLRAHADVESGGNRYAISPKGAMGVMQVMPDTYNKLREQYPDLSPNPFHARSNIMAGAAYLRQMHDQFGQEGALPAYNAGPGRPRRWREGGATIEAAAWAESIPFNETRDYVKKVLSNTTNYAALISGQPQSLKARLGMVGPLDATLPDISTELP